MKDILFGEHVVRRYLSACLLGLGENSIGLGKNETGGKNLPSTIWLLIFTTFHTTIKVLRIFGSLKIMNSLHFTESFVNENETT